MNGALLDIETAPCKPAHIHTHTQLTDATASLIKCMDRGTLAPTCSVALKMKLEHSLSWKPYTRSCTHRSSNISIKSNCTTNKNYTQ